jgi:hypothetical protein
MPTIPGLGSRIAEALDAVARPAVPDVVERLAGRVPVSDTVSEIAQRARGVPFYGNPEVLAETRATVNVTQGVADKIQALKTALGGFFRSEPNLGRDVQEHFYTARWKREAAGANATQDVAQALAPLTRDPVNQMALLADYMKTANDVAQARRDGSQMINNKPVEAWIQSLDLLDQHVRSDPEVQVAHDNVRKLLDDLHMDMVNRGYTTLDSYLEDYTPMRRIDGIVRGLANMWGEELKSPTLAVLRHRKGGQGRTETNLIEVLHDVLSDYYRKVPIDDLFAELRRDPTLNFTDQYAIGDAIKPGHAVYDPGPGMPGYARKTDVDYTVDGLLHSMPISESIKAREFHGGYVFPTHVAKALKRFNQRPLDDIENPFFHWGSKVARGLTVYNPANTNLNRASDLLLALTGLPGEQAHPLGILRWYGPSMRAAYNGVRGKGSTVIKIGGQPVDVWDLAQREGLTSGTIIHDIGGEPMPGALQQFIPEDEVARPGMLRMVLNSMQKDRMATEVTPRIAAGLEALERTGDIREFGRVGRDITLRFGAGQPAAARLPWVRMISPFMQFIGLATSRVTDALKTSGSRGRMIASLVAVPTAAMMWNNQSDEFKDVEHSLSDFERNQLHLIVADWNDPSKVKRDRTGKPVVLRFRFWVPEEVARTVGLGNLPSRIRRVAEGREKPIDFLKQTAVQPVQSISDLMTMPSLIEDFATGKSASGRQLSVVERGLRFSPAATGLAEGYRGYQNAGLAEGIKRTLEEWGAVRFAMVQRRGKTTLDADFIAAKRNLSDARLRYRIMLQNGDISRAREARKEMDAAITDIKSINAVRRREKTSRSLRKVGTP